MRISDWSSDVCSSDLMLLYAAKLINRATLKEWNQRLLLGPHLNPAELKRVTHGFAQRTCRTNVYPHAVDRIREDRADGWRAVLATASYRLYVEDIAREVGMDDVRTEAHKSELRSLMRLSYAVFCLTKNN